MNKELQEIATPILYRTVKLMIGGPKDMRLSAGLLSRDNPGLKHIRRLFLDLERVPVQKPETEASDGSSDEAEEFEDAGIGIRQANFTMRLLLDVIPVNTLEHFWYDISSETSYTCFSSICVDKRGVNIVTAEADIVLAGIIGCEPPSTSGLCFGKGRNASRRSK